MTAVSAEPTHQLAQTHLLLGFVLRRDRRRLTLWVLGLIALVWLSADSIMGLYDTPEAIQQYVTSVDDNPAIVMFAGPGYGFDDPNIGTILVNELSLWMALACAVMSMLIVIRHTRAEEDSGSADLVRAQPVGRNSPITAAVSVAMGANVVIGAISAAAMIAVGYDVAGSIALAGAFSLSGMVFAGVAAVAAQIAPTARSALGLTSAAMGLAYVARGLGDIRDSWLTWSSPFGWAIGVRAFAQERWWTLAMLAALAVLAVAVAFWLADRRDLGSGMLADRVGSPTAAGWLRNPAAMAWRLQRPALSAWVAGVFVLGLLFGSVSDAIESMVEGNPEIAEMVAGFDGATVTEGFLASSLGLLTLLSAGYGISSALRARTEETSGHVELVLATPTSRSNLALSHVAISTVGSAVVVLSAGLGLALGNWLVVGNSDEVGSLLLASVQLLPAALVFVGLAVALFGWLPRYTVAAWLVFAGAVVIGIVGDLLDLPSALTGWSPFEMLAVVPAEAFDAAPAVALVVAAVALATLGVVGFNRRDLSS